MINAELKAWKALSKEEQEAIKACDEVGVLRADGTIGWAVSTRWDYDLGNAYVGRNKTKSKVPMDPTTCPKFPWAIRRSYWPQGQYNAVAVVDDDGVIARQFRSWEELAQDDWLDHETGKPLYVEVDE